MARLCRRIPSFGEFARWRNVLHHRSACAPAFAAEPGEEIRVSPTAAPGSEHETAAEISEPSASPKLPKRFSLVHNPLVFVFLAPTGKAMEFVDKEGYEIRRLAECSRHRGLRIEVSAGLRFLVSPWRIRYCASSPPLR